MYLIVVHLTVNFQIHREFNIVAEGTGFRIFYIEKASVAAKKFGPKSAQKFGNYIKLFNSGILQELFNTRQIFSLHKRLM